jgi:hypothetical protein
VKQLENLLHTVHHMHFVRSFNGSADLLATEALKSKVSRVIDDKPTLDMLVQLNKLPEAVYIPDSVQYNQEDGIDVALSMRHCRGDGFTYISAK